ncbi:TIGR02206 family membrane protein [Bacillus timonensis]|uniref:TIGR02206 family membrane protein n=1 Tax=Bacillus timonensis TaxID=1033734 RepID=A0A4S3PK33_9BACI|nr:TIGR02206 family membrane protein [Bacillus timonensis]THE09797.1 TIGR02206 family membrane protein [Bacillus timonensis]
MFSAEGMQTFELFSASHIATLVLFLLLTSLLVVFRRKLRPYRSIMKWTFFAILVASEVSHQIWLLATHQWEVGELPLHLCSISTFICIFLFLQPSKKAFYLVFFTGLLPPFLSIVTPELFHEFPHYRFLKYFLHHATITWSVLYFIIFEGYRVPRKAVGTAFLLLNFIAVPIFFINLLLETNYFYLANPTESTTILSFFGSGIQYYVTLEIAGIIVFLITYLPMALLMKREKSH